VIQYFNKICCCFRCMWWIWWSSVLDIWSFKLYI